ncbi:MAG: UvrD-helicase domain-containing protein [Ignavibacteriaceae bacterium]|nr:UvrD-helicase domain-containing protein [Ignavibacteriaceae bacterium]
MKNLTPHQQIALNYHNHISLNANAGSGKTFVLSKRYVEIALNEKIPLNKIVAITFTDKAASELYKKISNCIEELLTISVNKSDIRQLESLRRQLISANISTIHSFCLNILREFPVEAELDANIIPINEKLSTELIEMSVDKMIKESLENDDQERIKKLIRMFSSKGLLSTELESLVKNYTKVIFIEDRIYSKSPEEIIEYYNYIIDEYFDKLIGSRITLIYNDFIRINNIVLSDKPDNATALNASPLINRLNQELQKNELIKTLSELRKMLFTKAGKISAKGYLKGTLREDFQNECEEIELFFDELDIFTPGENEYETWRKLSLFGKEILYFFRKSLSVYEELKSENGYLDYEDILYKTYNILKNPVVSEYLGDKYQYLMIDEYQDTNELQYNIFLPLLDNLKRGNLLVVGDEKQSIYMFREAELEVFRKTREDISGISGVASLLTLPDSFRMNQELCLFTNSLFKNLFHIPDPLFNEVEHSDLICARNEDDHGKVEFLFNHLAEQNSDLESDLVVKRLVNLVNNENGKYKWGDLTVLCRKRKSFSELEKKFAEYKVPFIIMGGKEFYQRQSVYDIYNYFSFLLDNNNDTALIGLLRSPFFAFSDDDIYKLSLYDGWTYWQKIAKIKNEEQRWESAYRLLNENTLLSKDIDFSVLFRKLLKESNFIPIMASRPDGIQEIANIEKLISLTSDFMKEGYKTLYDFVNYLKLSIEEKDDEPQAPISEESDAVKIMTLHQAKGLEFPVVVLYKCNETTIKSVIKSKKILADKTFGLLTKIPLHNDYYTSYLSTSINSLSEFISDKKGMAETKRLLYVGITRAQEHLIISFESNKEIKLQNGSFIWLLQKGFGIDFNREMFTVQGSLTFLVNNEGNYLNKEKLLSFNIPIIKDVQIVNPVPNVIPVAPDKYSLVNTIEDHISGEIISATRFSVFSQCPMKYYLRFEVGLNLINEFSPLLDKIDAGSNNDVDGSLKGRIIHSLLEKNIKRENLPGQTNIILEKEKIPPVEKKILLNEIIKDLDKYFSSDKHREIVSFPNFKNEFEVYLKLDEFYLYGRIDKVIFDDNKIKIIDYKTDNISPGYVKNRTAQYLSQVKFYSFILSRLYPHVHLYELQIVFIKNPDATINIEINDDDFSAIENEIIKMIDSLRNRDFIPNINQCRNCIYSANKIKCIKEYISP